MIKEAIEKILSLSPPNIIGNGGLNYTDKNLNLIKPPIIDSLTVHTLKGVTGLIDEAFEGVNTGDIFLHVVSPTHVDLLSLASNNAAERTHFVASDCEANLPKFGSNKFMETEAFIIGLQACFVPTIGDIDYLVKLTSSLTAGNILTAEDDGVSQRTTLKRGITLKEEVVVKPRVTLAPYRTFQEVEQPSSEFVFRLQSRSENQLPLCGLFDADGGKWKLTAMDSIAAWLARNAPEVSVIS